MNEPRALPGQIVEWGRDLQAVPRLLAHLQLVHDVAFDLLEQMESAFGKLPIDREAVLFGSASHDLGKCLHPNEITGPGTLHERDGPALLQSLGVPNHLARFAQTHGQVLPSHPLEDLVVIASDKLWKGKRHDELENLLTQKIVSLTSQEPWEIFSSLDQICSTLCQAGDQRLAWQATFSV